jgi:hypothetical protein
MPIFPGSAPQQFWPGFLMRCRGSVVERASFEWSTTRGSSVMRSRNGLMGNVDLGE